MANILIVEDQNDLCDVWREEIVSFGHDVQTAADGNTAWDALQNRNFDLIILDINLPQRSGLELLHLIRDHKIKTPIIIVTAIVGPNVSRIVIDAGANEILFKPIQLEDLINLIARLLQTSPTA